MRKSKKSKSAKPKSVLCIHKTKQLWYKMITLHGKRKPVYFGKVSEVSQEDAERAYYAKMDDLCEGHEHRPGGDRFVDLLNVYMDHQEATVAAGEVSARHVADQRSHLARFLAFVRARHGHNCPADCVDTQDLISYRDRLAKKYSPNTVNGHIAVIKAMYGYAGEAELLTKLPNLRAMRKLNAERIRARKTGNRNRQTLTQAEVRRIIEAATPKMKAMVLLGINAGYGNTDVAALRWDRVDLKAGYVDHPRPKTGVARRHKLMPETIAALATLPREGDLVFYTKHGNPWVRFDPNAGARGRHIDSVTKEFSRICRKAGVKIEKNQGFYILRRTSATVAQRSDVRAHLGHADDRMSARYVQDTAPSTEAAVEAIAKWWENS